MSVTNKSIHVYVEYGTLGISLVIISVVAPSSMAYICSVIGLHFRNYLPRGVLHWSEHANSLPSVSLDMGEGGAIVPSQTR